MEQFFQLQAHGTTVRTEVVAGISTFLAMAYILFVNPDMLAQGAALVGEDPQKVYNGVFFATCIASFAGTFLMAVYAKIPFAQAPGMGINAFFAFTTMAGQGYSYAEALAIVFISGLLFLLIALTGLKKHIIESIPANITFAISAGIGLFLAFVGLQNAGLVVASPATLVTLVDFSTLGDPTTGAGAMGAVLALVGLVITVALHARRVPGAVLIGIVATTLLGIPLGVTQLPQGAAVDFAARFADFREVSLLRFGEGLGGLFSSGGFAQNLLHVGTLVICFSLVDLFDTIGGLLGAAGQAKLLQEDGSMKGMDKALVCDAAATAVGAVLGTSTVTTYAESAVGIGEGGRTGLTSLTTSLLFLAAIVFAPVIGIVPSAATAPALIYVGCMMAASIKNLKMDDLSDTFPAILTILLMPLTYSVANGIAFGLISHVLLKLLCGRGRQLKPTCVILALIFVARFFIMGM